MKFIRQDIHKKARLAEKWRKPRGLQSKMRLQKNGHRPIVKTGYGKVQKETPLLVYTPSDLDTVEAKKGITIASVVGKRNKIEITKKAVEKNIPITNIKDPAAYLKETEQNLQEEKKKKEEIMQTRKKKKKDIEKKAEEKKKKDQKEESTKKEETKEPVLEKEIEKQDKKDKDKVLIKKEK